MIITFSEEEEAQIGEYNVIACEQCGANETSKREAPVCRTIAAMPEAFEARKSAR